jgi:hypothetical protein
MALDVQRIGVCVLLFQVLFWVAHLISKSVFAPKYLKLSPHDRNQWCAIELRQDVFHAGSLSNLST